MLSSYWIYLKWQLTSSKGNRQESPMTSQSRASPNSVLGRLWAEGSTIRQSRNSWLAHSCAFSSQERQVLRLNDKNLCVKCKWYYVFSMSFYCVFLFTLLWLDRTVYNFIPNFSLKNPNMIFLTSSNEISSTLQLVRFSHDYLNIMLT